MGIEIRILDLIQSIRTPVGDMAMILITRLGEAGAVWILLAVILLIVPKTRKSGAVLAAASFAAVAALMMAGEQKLWKLSLALAVMIAFSQLQGFRQDL